MALQSIRWPHPGDCDVAAHLSRINRLRHLAIHAIEAFSRRLRVSMPPCDGVGYPSVENLKAGKKR